MEKSFYILNPHRDDFIWEPLYFSYIKRRALKKYNYIAEIFTEIRNVKLLISDDCSGLIPQSILSNLPKDIRRILIKWEFKKWVHINNLPSNTLFYWLDEKLKIDKQDEIFMFQLSNEKYINQLNALLGKFSSVYVHLSHYYLDPKRISKTFSKLPNVNFCGDSDISKHPFFTKYFAWYMKRFILVPFYIEDRFKATKPLKNRIDKIITTGTFHPIEEYPNSVYLKEEIGVEAFHYNRRNIYENKQNIKDLITCYNSPWKQRDAPWYTKLWNANKVSQKSYFKMDIVEEYNNYKFALIGEEICGFPGIGSFEAMACGCKVLLDSNTIVGLNLKENIHYIEFKNKQCDLKTLQDVTKPFGTENTLGDFLKMGKSDNMKLFLATFNLY